MSKLIAILSIVSLVSGVFAQTNVNRAASEAFVTSRIRIAVDAVVAQLSTNAPAVTPAALGATSALDRAWAAAYTDGATSSVPAQIAAGSVLHASTATFSTNAATSDVSYSLISADGTSGCCVRGGTSYWYTVTLSSNVYAKYVEGDSWGTSPYVGQTWTNPVMDESGVRWNMAGLGDDGRNFVLSSYNPYGPTFTLLANGSDEAFNGGVSIPTWVTAIEPPWWGWVFLDWVPVTNWVSLSGNHNADILAHPDLFAGKAGTNISISVNGQTGWLSSNVLAFTVSDADPYVVISNGVATNATLSNFALAYGTTGVFNNATATTNLHMSVGANGVFNARANGGTQAALSIDSAGNVGLKGTTDANYALKVTGSASCSGSVFADTFGWYGGGGWGIRPNALSRISSLQTVGGVDVGTYLFATNSISTKGAYVFGPLIGGRQAFIYTDGTNFYKVDVNQVTNVF